MTCRKLGRVLSVFHTEGGPSRSQQRKARCALRGGPEHASPPSSNQSFVTMSSQTIAKASWVAKKAMSRAFAQVLSLNSKLVKGSGDESAIRTNNRFCSPPPPIVCPPLRHSVPLSQLRGSPLVF